LVAYWLSMGESPDTPGGWSTQSVTVRIPARYIKGDFRESTVLCRLSRI